MIKIPDESDSLKLRFAILSRVSTEGQEKKGESLRTQRMEMESAVEMMGGNIVKRYGGQEHATPGYERKELDQLLLDAQKVPRPFDAVMVANADRWSRDNAKSSESLEVLKKHGIRFFVGHSESNLFNPEHVFFLGMSAVFGQFQAQNQNAKSIRNRIARAERGIPTAGTKPYGRTIDEGTGKWVVDLEKKRKIEEIAARYLRGEWIDTLAKEYGIDRSCLYIILRERSGTIWTETFRSKALNINKVVTHSIPPLLSDETIKAVRARIQANRTYFHRPIKNRYLLSRMVICAHCGGSLSGQPSPNGDSWYRHMYPRLVSKKCLVEKTWIPAAELDDQVIRQLFETFGNPRAVQRAIEAATPNMEKTKEAYARIRRLEELIEKLSNGRNRILKFVGNGTISDQDAQKQLSELKENEQRYQDELNTLRDTIENLPTPEGIMAKASEVAAQFRLTDARLAATHRELNRNIDLMTWEQKRALVEMVFGGKTADGKRMGIHIEWLEPAIHGQRPRWRYSIVGHLINEDGWPLMSLERRKAIFGEGCGNMQGALVSESARH